MGPVTTTDGKIEIATKTAGTVEAPKEDVTLIRSDEKAYESHVHPGLMHGWDGGIDVGFSIARGNAQTENLALAFNATHPTLNDKITLYASSINTKNDLATPSDVASLQTRRNPLRPQSQSAAVCVCGRGLHGQCPAVPRLARGLHRRFRLPRHQHRRHNLELPGWRQLHARNLFERSVGGGKRSLRSLPLTG